MNGWVFVRRDAQETTFAGMEVSEGAQVLNVLGTVAFVEAGECVDVGDRVHLPSYQVSDVVVRGEEYAIVQASRLFAIEKNGVFTPINGYVKTLKCVNDHERDDDGAIVLYRTDTHLEKTNYVEITGVAKDCKHVTEADIASMFYAPESHDRLQRVLYTKEFMIHEDLIAFTTT